MSISRVDLSAVAVVDNHAHPLARTQPRDAEAFRRTFSEAHSPELARRHLPSAIYYHWALRQLGDYLGVAPDEEAILEQRVPFEPYARRLVADANLAYLLLDEGYPPPEQAYASAEMRQMLGVPVGRILRIETLLQDLILRHQAFADVVEAFDQTILGARSEGYISLKSIAAYRTGLAIEPVDEPEAGAAFRLVRMLAERTGTIRLTSKPLIDFFVWRAIRHAARQGLPIQFHTGYGDPDLDLRLANPLYLRPLFEDPELVEAPIVLLHQSYPYTAEAAYLASVYPNAYLDIAFCLPPLDRLELRRVAGIALGAAPAGKLMVSSDGILVPEHYWLGAVRAGEIISETLNDMIDAGELDGDDAQATGEMILRDNALRVYGLA